MVRAPDGSCSSSTMHSSATAPSSDMMPSFVTAGDLWKRCKLGCYGRSSMVKRRRTEILPIKDFVPIVADGAMAGPIAEGIRVHAYLPPGDVASSWGGIKGHPDDVFLVLDFERPIEARGVLRFSIANQGILVEAALTAKAMYLQAGKPGDRLRGHSRS